MLCEGQAISRTKYAALFSIIGTAFGSGDGASTFNLPDLRGRFLRGVDGTAGRDPDKTTRTAAATGGNTGNNVGSVQGSGYKSHSHSVSDFSVNTVNLNHNHTINYTSYGHSHSGMDPHGHDSNGNHSHYANYYGKNALTGFGGNARVVWEYTGWMARTADNAHNHDHWMTLTSTLDAGWNGVGTHTHSTDSVNLKHRHNVSTTIPTVGITELRPNNLYSFYIIKV
jgi:microcystin-dependent protein